MTGYTDLTGTTFEGAEPTAFEPSIVEPGPETPTHIIEAVESDRPRVQPSNEAPKLEDIREVSHETAVQPLVDAAERIVDAYILENNPDLAHEKRVQALVNGAEVLITSAEKFDDSTFIAGAESLFHTAEALVIGAKAIAAGAVGTKDLVAGAEALACGAGALSSRIEAFVPRAEALVVSTEALISGAASFLKRAEAFANGSEAFVNVSELPFSCFYRIH